MHPFVTGGVRVERERHEAFVFEERSTTIEASVHAAPFVGAGAKFFVSERAFIRTDIPSTVAGDDTRRMTWTAGVGVEF